jgi:hypothetical protein
VVHVPQDEDLEVPMKEVRKISESTTNDIKLTNVQLLLIATLAATSTEHKVLVKKRESQAVSLVLEHAAVAVARVDLDEGVIVILELVNQSTSVYLTKLTFTDIPQRTPEAD